MTTEYLDVQSPGTTAGPWEMSGDLIVGAPYQPANPKAQKTCHSVAKICWDFDGDCGANGELPWRNAKANGQLLKRAPELYDFLIQYLYSEHGICAAHHFAAPYSAEQLKDKATALIEKIEGSAE